MILITEFMDDKAVDRLRDRHETIYDPALVDQPDLLLSRVAGATALIVRNRTHVNERLLGAAGDLQCVGRLGVGLDNIDLDACRDRDIAVYPATGANNLSVAEYVVTAAMMLSRRAWMSNAPMRAGNWPRQDCAGHEIAGRTLGLIGFGAIARNAAKLARGLGMDAIAYDPYVPAGDPVWADVRQSELSALLAEADVISVHVPLSDATRHLIDADAMARMKSGAILVNTARGGVVDELALCEALRSGRLGGAALDVFETEPLDAEAAGRFREVPNLILTPHIAGVTIESNIRVSSLIADLVLDHLA